MGGRGGMSKRPYFRMDSQRLQRNLKRLLWLEKSSGAKILHTLKSFNHQQITPIIASTLSGFSISSIKELEIATKAKSRDIHLYAPAYKPQELEVLAKSVSTISFNSLSQWSRFNSTKSSLGLRINPKLHLPIPSYCNPNLSYSRLGVDYMEFIKTFFDSNGFKNLEGLHFHALFQSSVEGVFVLLEHIRANYQNILPQLKWINLGGGHALTDSNYDTKRFIELIEEFKKEYPHIQLYFEPGEAVVKDTGEFISTVLDIIQIEGQKIAILDTSIETHLLDVAIVNRRLRVRGTQSSSTPYYYQLTGNSCLQGDIIGEYFFQKELKVGDRIVFEDMMGYTMVKMTQFNGIKFALLNFR